MNTILITLHKYLALHKRLNIPGIGNFTIEETPATIQFTDKLAHPPKSEVKFAPVVHPTNNHFYSFLSRELKVEKVIAIRLYKEAVEGILEQLQTLGLYQLPGIGILRKTFDGSLVFAPEENEDVVFTALPAERVMRKDALHTVLVGEIEHRKAHTIPVQPEDDYIEREKAKDLWWIYVLILTVIAILIIVYYYATHPAQ